MSSNRSAWSRCRSGFSPILPRGIRASLVYALARLRIALNSPPCPTSSPPPSPAVPIKGRSELFAVHRIYCVGRNYAAHAREMGANPDREPPFFFTKPADAIVPNHARIPYPPRTNNFHHEIELVVAIGKGWPRHPGRAGARPRLRLCGRQRSDSARPASRTPRTTAGRGIPARASTAPRSSAPSRRPRSRDTCAAAGSGSK